METPGMAVAAVILSGVMARSLSSKEAQKMKRGLIGRLFPLMFSKVVYGVSYCCFFQKPVDNSAVVCYNLYS